MPETATSLIHPGWFAAIAILLWATSLLPEYLTALLFFAAVAVFHAAPPDVLFSGFQSEAFWLVLGGCGAAVFAANPTEHTSIGIGFLGVAIAFGLTVLTGVYAFGAVSGGHFNPAVTLGAALARRIEWKALPVYWIAQVVGGLVAACGMGLALAFPSVPGTIAGFAASRLRRWIAPAVITALVLLGQVLFKYILSKVKRQHVSLKPEIRVYSWTKKKSGKSSFNGPLLEQSC